jgi:hypothetical protein
MVSDNDSGYTTNNPVIRDIKPGIIIAYRLKPSDRPTNPNKLWRGKVKWCNSYGILVEILEEDYTGLAETISYEQVLSIEYS